MNFNNLFINFFNKNKKVSFFSTSIFFIAFYWVYKNLIKSNNNNNNNNQKSDKDNKDNSSSNNDSSSSNDKKNEEIIIKKVKFNNFFKLSNNIKIHVLNTPEQCDLILNEFYESLLSKMDSTTATTTTTTTTPVSVDGADVITSQSTSNSASPLLFPNCNEKNDDGLDFILGFDAEWSNENSISSNEEDGNEYSNQYKHKVALIQLANKDNCYLIQVSQMATIPESLEKILCDPRLIKVGVAVSQDAATIFQSFSIVTKGCVDLVPIARLTNFEGNGLASLALNVLNVTLDKNNFVRCSHWENKQLSNDQIHYAAADAWVGREIFQIMYNSYKKNKIDPNEKDLVYTLCRPFINTNFKLKVKSSSSSSNGGGSSNGNNNNNNTRVKENLLKKSVPDKRVLYDNCLMYSDSDVLLCSISKKKVEWYVSRGLATVINQEPLTIKLNFKPHGEGHSGDDYYLAHKENICVVCGSTHKILRHSVVPHCYRQYLPEEVKSHSSHDVLLLCCDCHANMDKRTQIMRMMIAKQYNVPLENENKAYIIDHSLLKISKMALIVKNVFYSNDNGTTAASASNEDNTNNNDSNGNDKDNSKTIKKIKTKIPDYKLEEMKKEIAEYFGKSEFEVADLNQLIYLNPKQKNENYVPHEKQVMDKVLSLGEYGIFEFVRSWRKNFIETVQPKFLNEHWSIDKEIINSYKPKSQKQKQVQL